MDPSNIREIRVPPSAPAGVPPGIERHETAPPDPFVHAVTIATVAGFVAQGLGAGTHVTAILSVVCVVAAYFGIKFLRKHSSLMGLLDASPFRLSAIIAIALASMLIGVLLRQHEIDQYSLDIGELADTFNWKIRLCRHDAKCIAAAVSSLNDQVPESSTSFSEQVFRDQALGKITKTAPESIGLLKKLYGVDERFFLGVGESLPSGRNSFSDARIPEYLVPNYRDGHEGVIVWRLHPKLVQENKGLSEIIMSTPSLKPTDTEELQTRRGEIKKHLGLDDPAPAVVRFAQIPDSLYSGCLGLPQRQYVFASHLGMLMASNLTVEEAARLSGYSLQKNKADQDLYVFVFIPSHEEEVVRPTWRRVTSLIASEGGEQSYCK